MGLVQYILLSVIVTVELGGRQPSKRKQESVWNSHLVTVTMRGTQIAATTFVGQSINSAPPFPMTPFTNVIVPGKELELVDFGKSLPDSVR